MRLLNEILYKYLAEQTAISHIGKFRRSSNFWLANAYYERGMHDLLRSDIDGFIAESSIDSRVQESMNSGESSALLSMKSLWLIETQPKLAANIQQQMDTLKQWKREEKKRFLFRLREMEAREAYLMQTLSNVLGQKPVPNDDIRTPGQTLIDFSDIPEDGPLFRYAMLKKHAYQTQGTARIAVLLETLDMVSTPEAVKALSIKARLGTLTQLGMEMILACRHQEGNDYLAQAIRESEEHKRPVSYSTVHNYMTNQINTGDYHKGIEVFDKYRSLIDANRLRHASRLFAAYCYLYTGDADAALELLPRETDLSIQLQIIARSMYPITYMMRGEYALAVSELKNLRRMIKSIKTGGSFDRQLDIADAFLRYATAMTKSKAERQRLLSALQNDIASDMARWQLWATVDVQLHWLLKQLK